MVLDLIGLAFLGLVAVALLRFVPRPASRVWAVGLLIFAVISNLSALIVTIAAYFSPPILYLDAEKNQLQFNRGEKGEVYGVAVKNPPEECRVTDRIDHQRWPVAIWLSPQSPWYSCGGPQRRLRTQVPRRRVAVARQSGREPNLQPTGHVPDSSSTFRAWPA